MQRGLTDFNETKAQVEQRLDSLRVLVKASSKAWKWQRWVAATYTTVVNTVPGEAAPAAARVWHRPMDAMA